MSIFTASLYFLAIASLFGSCIFVLSQNPRARLNQYYAILSCALLAWVASLFIYQATGEGDSLLWIGRLNFAVVLIAATASYLFVSELGGLPKIKPAIIWFETALIVFLTLYTGAVDHQELVAASGQHSTIYGPLFWLYLVHIVGYVGAAIALALRPKAYLLQQARLQLSFVGYGLLIMTVVALVTNVYLPFVQNDFRFIDCGTLATLAFVAAVGFATFALHMFNIQVIIRATLVAGLLVGFALELYQAAVTFFAHLLPLHNDVERTFAATTVALIINSLTQQPLRKRLERILDLLIKPGHIARNR